MAVADSKAKLGSRNQWVALNRYVEDGDLSIDNNFAERAMRPKLPLVERTGYSSVANKPASVLQS